jgi:hypothetical protein
MDIELQAYILPKTANVPAFGPCVNQISPAVNYKVAPAKKKDNKMSRYYDEDMDCYVESSTPKTDAQMQRNYFTQRISGIRFSKTVDLQRQFGLMGDPAPETFDDFVSRINAGKFYFEKESNKKNRWWRDYIEWRDPAVQKDEAGFEAAMKAFRVEEEKAADAVMALPAADAMAAVQALETWTPTTPAS